MTDPTRGARLRRGGRRPGWILMTVLLVLAIAASSALVFTNRVELLKLAVILALWAAVVAAFVSVIYRRQSDSDQAKVRDLKLVYDLQLDREISARREYELSVEAQLRRELVAELRAQQSDEVSALRTELAALRANLEFLFDADLSHRHAIEADRSPDAGPWTPRSDTAGRVSSSRIDTEDTADEGYAEVEEVDPHTEESPIIDVPAEPHPPESERPPAATEPRGSHRRSGDDGSRRRRTDQDVRSQWAPQAPPRPAGPTPPPAAAPPPATPPPAAAPPTAPPPPGPAPQYPWLPQPAAPRTDRPAAAAAQQWQPAPSEGHWRPVGEPGSHWAAEPESAEPESAEPDAYVGRRRAAEPQEDSGQGPRGRHYAGGDAAEPEPVAEESADDQDAEEPQDGAHTGGQSVADLMARLQVTPSGGGRRRRRED